MRSGTRYYVLSTKYDVSILPLNAYFTTLP
jgi:hypothetical protein